MQSAARAQCALGPLRSPLAPVTINVITSDEAFVQERHSFAGYVPHHLQQCLEAESSDAAGDSYDSGDNSELPDDGARRPCISRRILNTPSTRRSEGSDARSEGSDTESDSTAEAPITVWPDTDDESEEAFPAHCRWSAAARVPRWREGDAGELLQAAAGAPQEASEARGFTFGL